MGPFTSVIQASQRSKKPDSINLTHKSEGHEVRLSPERSGDHWSLPGPETDAFSNLFHIAVNKQTLQLRKELYETLK